MGPLKDLHNARIPGCLHRSFQQWLSCYRDQKGKRHRPIRIGAQCTSHLHATNQRRKNEITKESSQIAGSSRFLPQQSPPSHPYSALLKYELQNPSPRGGCWHNVPVPPLTQSQVL